MLKHSEEYKDVAPALGEVEKILAEHKPPGPLPQRYESAQEYAALFLSRTKKNGPVERAAELTKLEARVSSLKTSLFSLEANESLSLLAETVRTSLKEAQAELDKRNKDVPTPLSEQAGITEALAAFNTATTERKGRAQRGNE